ncbi:hypothetical protein JHW43_009596 [Diplocarpon mali]|nr:hypothetical protein JHW43_009596 [Diplocarpon mali]
MGRRASDGCSARVRAGSGRFGSGLISSAGVSLLRLVLDYGTSVLSGTSTPSWRAGLLTSTEGGDSYWVQSPSTSLSYLMSVLSLRGGGAWGREPETGNRNRKGDGRWKRERAERAKQRRAPDESPSYFSRGTLHEPPPPSLVRRTWTGSVSPSTCNDRPEQSSFDQARAVTSPDTFESVLHAEVRSSTVHCNPLHSTPLQHTTTYYNILLSTTHYNNLQHTPTHSNRLHSTPHDCFRAGLHGTALRCGALCRTVLGRPPPHTSRMGKVRSVLLPDAGMPIWQVHAARAPPNQRARGALPSVQYEGEWGGREQQHGTLPSPPLPMHIRRSTSTEESPVGILVPETGTGTGLGGGGGSGKGNWNWD